MDFLESLEERAKKRNRHVVFPEGEDSRVVRAARYLVENSICRVTLLTNSGEEITEGNAIQYIQPRAAVENSSYAQDYHEKRSSKGITLQEAKHRLADPLYYGAAMVAAGDADGCVAGAVSTTGEVLRAGIRTIGLQQSISLVSSIFLMVLRDGKVLTYGDCGVVPYPDSGELAEIALTSAETHKKLVGKEPSVAMLSYSTLGSAEHESIQLVRDALQIAKKRNPELKIDGEFQFDAAYNKKVAERKAPDSEVAGNANVFIFPNLDAGNISYKITERLAGARAIGPIIQGLSKPMMDLSRGCSWQDIVHEACVAILMGD